MIPCCFITSWKTVRVLGAPQGMVYFLCYCCDNPLTRNGAHSPLLSNWLNGNRAALSYLPALKGRSVFLTLLR
jgi:hypothetical protein